MKLRSFMITCFIASGISLFACPEPTETLTHQYETGMLQQRVRDIDPHTLIHKAILENSPEIIRFLLDQGVDVDYADPSGMSPLTTAILNRCNYAIDVLLAHDADTNPNVRWNNMTLLELTFHMKDWESAKKLLKHGSNVNGYINGNSLLYYTLERSPNNPDFKEIAQDMINLGADINAPEIFMAIYIASLRADLNGIDGDTSILELMVERGIDINNEDLKYGYSNLLLHAIERWKSGVIELLIKSGADVNKIGSINGQESTPLITAISSGQLERVIFLVENGAKINKPINFKGIKTFPLNFALEKSTPEIVQYLLQKGARG